MKAGLFDIATFIDVEKEICPNQACNLIHGYRDDDHLQPKVLEQKAVWLDDIFK